MATTQGQQPVLRDNAPPAPSPRGLSALQDAPEGLEGPGRRPRTQDHLTQRRQAPQEASASFLKTSSPAAPKTTSPAPTGAATTCFLGVQSCPLWGPRSTPFNTLQRRFNDVLGHVSIVQRLFNTLLQVSKGWPFGTGHFSEARSVSENMSIVPNGGRIAGTHGKDTAHALHPRGISTAHALAPRQRHCNRTASALHLYGTPGTQYTETEEREGVS